MAVQRARAAVVEAPSINPLSIIIPTYGDIEQVADLLTVLQPLRQGGVELLVANGMASQACRARALESHANLVLECRRGRARQMNAAAARASGEVLLFLHADSKVDLSLFQPFLSTSGAGRDWGFYRVKIEPMFGLLSLVAKLMNWRSGITHIATGDQALWVKRQLFERVGGFPDQALMEDIELCTRLNKIAKPHRYPGIVVTSARRWQKHGQIKTILTMWWLRLRYWLGANPEHLAAIYYPHGQSDS